MASVIRGDDNFDSATDFSTSTDFGAVGTYILAAKSSATTENSTLAGSSLKVAGLTMLSYVAQNQLQAAYNTRSNTSPSGTWRAMCNSTVGGYGSNTGLWVRIS